MSTARDSAATVAGPATWSTTCPARRSLLGDAIVHGVEPAVRIKLPAPARIQPSRPRDPEHPSPDDPGDPLARFLTLRPRYAARLEAADGLDLGKVKVRSPFIPLLRVNLDTAFRIAVGHEHRHLEQARKVMAQDEFPADRPHP